MEDNPIICQIHATKNYDMFKFLQGNRPIQNACKLKENIELNNKLHLHPIIVNKDFEIIDGQHRWSIAKEKNLYIYYIIDESHGDLDLILHNSASKLWKLSDYAYFYANYEGKDLSPDIKKLYQYTIQVKNKYNFTYEFMLRTFLTVKDTNSRRNESLSINFKRGKISLQKNVSYFNLDIIFEKIYEVISYFLKLKLIQRSADNLTIALYNLISIDGYNHSRFMKKIDQCLEDIIIIAKFRTIPQTFDRLLAIYNKNAKYILDPKDYREDD